VLVKASFEISYFAPMENTEKGVFTNKNLWKIDFFVYLLTIFSFYICK